MTFDRSEVDHIAQAMENEVGASHALRLVLAELARLRGKMSAGLIRQAPDDTKNWPGKPQPPAILIDGE